MQDVCRGRVSGLFNLIFANKESQCNTNNIVVEST